MNPLSFDRYYQLNLIELRRTTIVLTFRQSEHCGTRLAQTHFALLTLIETETATTAIDMEDAF